MGKAKKTAFTAIAAGAVKVLQDEKLRAQLIGTGSAVTSQVKRWNDDRLAAAGDGRRNPVAAVSLSFGQGKLESRVRKLEDAVELLRRNAQPGADASFAEVEHAVAQIRLATSVARNLPRAKRRPAQAEISRVLDEMERAVFDAAMHHPLPGR